MILLLIGVILIVGLFFFLRRKKKKPPVPTPPPPPSPSGQHLTLINQSSLVSDVDIAAYVMDQDSQLRNEFAAAWNTQAFIDTQAGGWPVYLLDNADVPGALGYHDFNTTPFAKVFVRTSLDAGVSWQSVASHEVLEMVADPGPTFQSLPDAQGNLWALEVGDPVEDTLDGSLSNFILPAWFVSGSQGPWDDKNVLTHDHGLTAGGYAIENGQQVFGPAAKADAIHTDKDYVREK